MALRDLITTTDAARVVADALSVARAQLYAAGDYSVPALADAFALARMVAVRGATRRA